MTRITLKDAIASCEAQDLAPDWPENQVIMAAAKAFACEQCKGTGTTKTFRLATNDWLACPACAEYRKIASEGVEG